MTKELTGHPKFKRGKRMTLVKMLEEAKKHALAYFEEWEKNPFSNFATMELYKARTFLRAMGYAKQESSIIVEDEWFKVWNDQKAKDKGQRTND